VVRVYVRARQRLIAEPWQATRETVPGGVRYCVTEFESPLSFGGLFDHLESNPDFADFYTHLLSGSEFQAFFWELPALTLNTLDQPAEFVLVDAPSLSRAPVDPSPFESTFAAAGKERVVSFDNLDGDALLVAPCPIPARIAASAIYGHLASFVRDAPASQIEEFWRCVACTFERTVSQTPVWISTSGLGVIWLHVRLDSYPKYYTHAPYRTLRS
jgi:hypothetical protein